MRASWSQSLHSAAALVFAVFLAGNPLWCQQSTQSSADQTRTEKDLLGEKQVPANACYGVQTLRALENFPARLNRVVPVRSLDESQVTHRI